MDSRSQVSLSDHAQNLTEPWPLYQWSWCWQPWHGGWTSLGSPNGTIPSSAGRAQSPGTTTYSQPPTCPRLLPTRLSTHHLTPALLQTPQVSQLSMVEFLEMIRCVIHEERATILPGIQDSTGDGDIPTTSTSTSLPTSQLILPPMTMSSGLPLTSTHLATAPGSAGPAPTSGTLNLTLVISLRGCIAF